MVTLEQDWFALDGIPCTNIGLTCDTPPVQIMAKRNGSSYTTGTDESSYVDDNSFSDITFKFRCFYILPDDMDTTTLYAYFQGRKILTMSRNTFYYYRIRRIDCTPSQSYDGKRIDFTVSIQCAPFKYVLTDPEVNAVNGTTATIENSGTRFCKPIYEITISGWNELGGMIVNGQGVTFNPAKTTLTSKITIDTEKMICYNASGGNCMLATTGKFPYFNVGTNYVLLSGIFASAKIKRNQRSY